MLNNGKLPNLKLTNGHQGSQDEEYNSDKYNSNSPGRLLEERNCNIYGRPTHSRRENSKYIVKKSSSGARNIKNNKNLSVDVREYFNEGKPSKDFKIPIRQSHGENRRGNSNIQLATNPEDLNLLFYNFNMKNDNEDSDRILEEQEELEDDFDLGPTNCRLYYFILMKNKVNIV